jgi:L-ascorbate metabolism protein UlaG (beta-lactamase superfamily)
MDSYRPSNHGLREVLRWMATRRPSRWPRWRELDSLPAPPERLEDSTIRWHVVNHSTVLLQSAGMNLLTDPIWSLRCSPFSFAGPRRVHSPRLQLDDLPPIDAVLLSHDHYDHCDLPTLRRLARRDRPVLVAGRRMGEVVGGLGFRKVVELDWWQTTELSAPETPPLTVTFTPARHFSGRGALDRNRRRWGGFVLSGATVRPIYYAGDTGYSERLFRDIAERTGSPVLALLPIGAYEPRWFMRPVHVDPDEAVRAHLALGAERSVGVHYGTFQLTDEGIDEPIERLADALRGEGLPDEVFVAGGSGAVEARP